MQCIGVHARRCSRIWGEYGGSVVRKQRSRLHSSHCSPSSPFEKHFLRQSCRCTCACNQRRQLWRARWVVSCGVHDGLHCVLRHLQDEASPLRFRRGAAVVLAWRGAHDLRLVNGVGLHPDGCMHMQRASSLPRAWRARVHAEAARSRSVQGSGAWRGRA